VPAPGTGQTPTRTDALLPQSETGKINCVRRPRYGRLSPGAGVIERAARPSGFIANWQPSRGGRVGPSLVSV